MSAITITDVAEAAGVSMKSVSRVINGEPHVTAKLRAKVEQAMRELNYVPNMAARSLAGSKSFAIAVLFDNPSPAYVMKVQEGAYAACRRLDRQLVIENIDTRGDVVPAMEAILRRRLDGMVVTPPATDCEAVLDSLDRSGLPYVRIAPLSFPGRSAAVTVDDRIAAAAMAEHVLQLGHRDFGIVNGPDFIGVSAERRAGFLSALDHHGARSVRETVGAFTFASGVEAGLDLLGRQDRPTAILAANDDMAAGVYAAALQLGIRIPEDLSVAGFDDSWIAQSVWPALTTVYQPITEMADAAVALLVEREPDCEPIDLAHDHQLIVRESVARPTRCDDARLEGESPCVH